LCFQNFEGFIRVCLLTYAFLVFALPKPEAIAMASQRGLTASEVAAQVNNTDEINSSNPLAMLADVGRLLAMPQQKELSPYEQEQALNKARERGLPKDWSVKCNKWGNKKVWISPQGKICNSIVRCFFFCFQQCGLVHKRVCWLTRCQSLFSR
jgi:hypothetical protein